MSKQIKKAKKPFYWFVIISLINSFVLGAVFNFNFTLKLPKISVQYEHGSINVSSPQAKADVATTTVTVQNAPPAFTVDPAESPVSTSTSPVNVGGTISFTATADDPEDNSYYLIVCDSPGVTAHNGAAPTCDNTQFCVSGLTADTNQATCVYNNVTDPGSEIEEWYAYVCDNHATEADCSSYSQGSAPNIAASSSPFYVNHAPVFTAVNTTIDNQEPGGTFTFTASTTDSDVEGGADVLYLYICDTNSWATSTGCGGTTLCTATSTSPNVSCDWTSPIPTADQAYTYYAFVKDWHEMPASNNPRTNTYTVINVAPTIGAGSIVLNNGNDINLNIRGAPEVVVVASSSTVIDNNGCSDLANGTSTIYLSSVTGGPDCTADDNNCYQIGTANCMITDCSGTTAHLICSTTMAFYTIPTDTGDYSASSWFVRMTAIDDDGAKGSNSYTTLNGVEVIASAALDVSESQIDYGTVKSSFDTGDYNATTTIVNYGNTPLDSDISGTDMTKGTSSTDKIPANQQTYDLSNFTYPGTYTLSSTTPATLDVVVPRPTSTADVSDQVFWGIAIPAGTPSGDYGGTNTFQAAVDSDGNWN